MVATTNGIISSLYNIVIESTLLNIMSKRPQKIMEPVHVEMQPFSGEVDMNRLAILIIDMQVRKQVRVFL